MNKHWSWLQQPGGKRLWKLLKSIQRGGCYKGRDQICHSPLTDKIKILGYEANIWYLQVGICCRSSKIVRHLVWLSTSGKDNLEKSVFSKKMSEKSISRQWVFFQLNEIARPLQLMQMIQTYFHWKQKLLLVAISYITCYKSAIG